ncbi:MAG: amidohydrolase/deacetylase family metallohydrolase [Planctomycetes bacterium]|nr:amidohydrolase/deacetylase family metallohydrolase [Planctomycetota bacterium]
MSAYDLVIRHGTVIDPSAGLHGRRDVAIAGGRIAAVAEPGTLEAARSLDASGRLVTPGLIDLHAHVFDRGSRFGVPADACCLRRGTTTAVDAGSAGAITWGLLADELDRQATRVFALLHISMIGMPADGELLDGDWPDVSRAVETIAAHRDRLIGVKVRLSPRVVGANLQRAFERALEAAQRAGVPLMVHPNAAAMPMEAILERLRPGDIVTHCFNPSPQSVVDGCGTVHREAFEARRRGVLFDVGHGAGSFSFERAERALAQGFAPDVISSDLNSLCVDGPAWDLPCTMSKFLLLGLALDDVVARATARPGALLPVEGLGTLRPGAPADVVLLERRQGRFEFIDGARQRRTGGERLVATAVVRDGHVVDGVGA